MSGEHTPGPWTFLEQEDTESVGNAGGPLTICGPANDDLANVYSSDDSTVSIPREQAIANAHLISAAPEMLAALESMVDRWEPDCGGTDRRMWEDACAAIAKVRGQGT